MSVATRGLEGGGGGADGDGIRVEKEVLENVKEILKHSDGRDTCLPPSGFPFKSVIDRWIPLTVQSYSGTLTVKLFSLNVYIHPSISITHDPFQSCRYIISLLQVIHFPSCYLGNNFRDNPTQT